jgi:predicted RecB family nuclease
VLRFDGRLVYAASDLNDFLDCDHRVALNRLAAARGERPPANDATLEIIARKGELHERSVLARLEASGVNVVRIDEGDGSPAGLERAAQATRRAMRSGAEAIYQATLIDGRWLGRADFLLRTDVPSALGAWSYDVADAKLAVREKAGFVVQLCVYADLVAAVQGTLPRTIHALFGDGRDVPYAAERYVAYVRAARERFEAAVDELDPAAVPDRVAACGTCAWAETCEGARRQVDHLSLVAGMRRTQTARLRDAGIATLASLAAAPDDARPARLAETTFTKLRRQAGLQLTQRASGVPSYVLLEPHDGAGFALLPEPDDADVYFDMEGDPLYEPGVGLEYLFGAYVHGAEPAYQRFWGETRDQEKAAFEKFVDWLVEHRREHPRAHVYHYAPYEKTALRRLAMYHGTREDEVDALLRGQVLVDLYAVVGGAVAQSAESYSIKKLEPLYGFTRSTDVRKGDDSIVAFERYLIDRDAATREDIVAYNEEDCVSTYGLHRWLQTLRDEAQAKYGEIPYRAAIDPKEPTDKERKDAEQRTALQAALLEGAPAGDPRRLMAHLLGYHRREAKPVQWAVFERSERAGWFDFAGDDTEALGGIELCEEIPPSPVPRSSGMIYTYRFPRQQHKLGRDPVDARTTKSAGTVVSIDDDECLLRLKRSGNAPHPTVLGPGWPIRTDEQQAALARLAEAVLDGSAEQRYGAAYDLLRNAPPRIRGVLAGDFVQPTLRPQAQAIDPSDVSALACGLIDSTLVVQGPPGSGKTYTGAHVIADLLAEGKRVGVTSTGHQAIHNLLHEVERVVHARGASFRGVKKSTGPESEFRSRLAQPFIESVGVNAGFGEYGLVAGTSWLFSRADLERLDVLVIDEAGQVSLADALAMATSARSVVLLGDPMQLAHVSLAAHPEESGPSVLRHLLGDAATIAPDRGVFLDRSFRMAPPLCAFVSALAYEGRLEPAQTCANQRVDATAFAGAGLHYVPIVHEGNAQSSPEEADAVAELMDNLLGGTFTACDGTSRPLCVDDILVVSPYNHQVSLLRRTLRARFGDGVRVGTVDKFQGQEAPVVIYSLAASSAEDAPRGADFLLEENRFNVAVSRGRALAVLICSPRIFATPCTSLEQLRAVAAFCAFAAGADPKPAPAPQQLSLLTVA